MHDYQLERLNTRSFEQLIQALGTEILGPQLMIFGDGPDGGREATVKEDYPYQLEQLFDFIDSGGKSGPHLEAFLVELIKHHLLDCGPALLKQAAELLVKLVERRPAISSLPDPTIRQAEWR